MGEPTTSLGMAGGVAWPDMFVNLQTAYAELTQMQFEQEQRTAELAEARDLFDQALETLTEGLFVADQFGHVTRVNRAAAQLLQRRADEIVGRSLAEFWADTTLPTTPWLILAHGANGRFGPVETQLQAAHGGSVPVSLSCAVMRDTNSKITGVLAVARDIREVRALADVIRELSSPVIPIFGQVIVMPLVGHIDSKRAQRITGDLLKGIEAHQTRVAILDITGVPLVDTQVAHYLVRVIQAASLLGTRCLLVGICPEVAASLVSLSVSLEDIQTSADLQQGVRQALRMIGLEVHARR